LIITGILFDLFRNAVTPGVKQQRDHYLQKTWFSQVIITQQK